MDPMTGDATVSPGSSGGGPTGPKKGRVVAGESSGGGVDEEGNGVVESGGLSGGEVSGRDRLEKVLVEMK